MTISTYTEPQPVNIAVDESQQPCEIDEDVEEGAFAKLLAGLLKKTEIDEAGIEAVDFSGGKEGIQLFGAKDTGRISIFENETEKAENPGTDLEKLFLEKDLSETGIPEEQAGFFVSAEQFFTRINDQTADDETAAGFLLELPEIETPDLILAGEDVDFSDYKTDAFVFDSAMDDIAQTLPPLDSGMEFAAETTAAKAAAQRDKESQSVDNDSKSERVFSKDAAVEIRPESGRSEELAAMRKEPEKAGQNRLDEARSRRRDRVTVDVRDQRTASDSGISNNTQARINAGAETVSGRHIQTDAPHEMTLELRLPEGQTPQAQTTWEVRSGNALENMLARELHQNFNGDIVRHASIALRDGGEATIRLNLKPESLGNVKIHLELSENKITGRIVVESEEALNAFRKEISSLEQAFRDSGLENADLNLSLAANSGNAEGKGQETDVWTPLNAALRYNDSSLDGADQAVLPVDVFFGHRPGLINIFA